MQRQVREIVFPKDDLNKYLDPYDLSHREVRSLFPPLEIRKACDDFNPRSVIEVMLCDSQG